MMSQDKSNCYVFSKRYCIYFQNTCITFYWRSRYFTLGFLRPFHTSYRCGVPGRVNIFSDVTYVLSNDGGYLGRIRFLFGVILNKLLEQNQSSILLYIKQTTNGFIFGQTDLFFNFSNVFEQTDFFLNYSKHFIRTVSYF